jgi:hypothetical protein
MNAPPTSGLRLLETEPMSIPIQEENTKSNNHTQKGEEHE